VSGVATISLSGGGGSVVGYAIISDDDVVSAVVPAGWGGEVSYCTEQNRFTGALASRRSSAVTWLR